MSDQSERMLRAAMKDQYRDMQAEIERLRGRLDEATDLLGFAEARLLAFGQHRSSNPDYVLAMDAIKLFLMTEDATPTGAADQPSPRSALDELHRIDREIFGAADQPDAAPKPKRAYYETHEPPHCPTCRCGLDRHPDYVIGNHWLESAYERICAGEAEAEVLADYGVTRTADNSST